MPCPAKTAGCEHLWERLLPVLPFVLAVIVFSRVLSNDFTYDDFLVIVNNHYIADASLPGACFSSEYFRVSAEGTYRPGVTLFYHLLVRLFGRRPFGLHMAALLLHACTAAMVTRLARRIGLGRWALLPGIAFATHPILTEAICGIGFMEDVISTFFVVGGILATLWSIDQPVRPTRLACGTVLTIMALLAAAFSKESGIVLALFVPVFLLFPTNGRPQPRAACLAAAVLTPAVCLFLYVRFHLLPGDSASAERLGGGLVASAANTTVIFAGYLGRLCYPLELSVQRHTELLSGPGDIRLWPAVALHAAILAGTLPALRSQRLRAFALGIFWLYAGLLPTANIIPIFHPEADRYLYMPSVGFFLALGALAHALSRARPAATRVLVTLFALPALAWSTRTVTRIADWRNNTALWSHELEINPDSDIAMSELAVEANAAGRYVRAAELARSALHLNEHNSLARLQLARALMRNSRHMDALPLYEQLVTHSTLQRHHVAQAWHEMGFIREYTLKDLQGAAKAYSAALAVNPFILDAWIRLGMIHATSGRTAAAIETWERGLEVFPNDKALAHNIGAARRALKTGNEGGGPP